VEQKPPTYAGTSGLGASLKTEISQNSLNE